MREGDRLENLSPRMSETLRHLLSGASEKEIANSLGLSPHTVHDYVKALHKRLGVSSRGELLAAFVSGAMSPPAGGVSGGGFGPVA